MPIARRGSVARSESLGREAMNLANSLLVARATTFAKRSNLSPLSARLSAGSV
jgi:hypothetical protein